MVLGIIVALLFLISSLIPLIVRKKQNSKGKKAAMRVHCLLSIVTTIVAAIHFILTLPLLRQRPLSMFVCGIIMLVGMVFSCVWYLVGKKSNFSHKVHRYIAMIILLALCFHCYFGITSLSQYQKRIASIEIEGVNLKNVKDGTYEGECDAGYIYAKVRVDVSEGIITDISIIEHRNERGAAAENIIDSIIKQQTVQVDAISSATNSSNVIKKAFENALNK